MKETDWSYIAGFIDGEGCISLQLIGKYKSVVLRIGIRHTNKKILEYLKNSFGGTLCDVTHNRFPHWKPSYDWSITGNAAVNLLSKIEPYVRIKIDQIDIAMAWHYLRSHGGKTSDEHKDKMQLLVDQMHWLNKKGRHKPALSPAKIIFSKEGIDIHAT